jgi:hypothetical protein
MHKKEWIQEAMSKPNASKRGKPIVANKPSMRRAGNRGK